MACVCNCVHWVCYRIFSSQSIFSESVWRCFDGLQRYQSFWKNKSEQLYLSDTVRLRLILLSKHCCGRLQRKICLYFVDHCYCDHCHICAPEMYILKTPKGCQTLLILIAYPIAACFVYLMVEPWDVHAVMTFGQAFAFCFGCMVLLINIPKIRTKVEGALCKAAVALLGVLVTLNIRYSNILYLKADVMQTQMISYYTTLITRIESIEGYTEDAQVVYIGEYDKHDKNLVGESANISMIWIWLHIKESLFSMITHGRKPWSFGVALHRN